MHSEVNSIVSGTPKAEAYDILISQVKGILDDEDNLISGLANVVAILHRNFNWWWTGFYLVQNEKLVLGPFQGDVACNRIDFGKGVCGTAWKLRSAIVVEDVDQFPGHIACSAASKSEIVVPVIVNDNVVAVLDVDSEFLGHFDEVDREKLEQVASILAQKGFWG